MSHYNYSNFPLDMEADIFAAFRDHLKVGERAPKGTLTDAATGEPVKLAKLWKSGPLMVEFGSQS